MEGVTILSSFQVATDYNISIVWAFIIWTAIIVICGIVCEIWLEFGGFGVLLGFLAGLLILGAIIQPANYETRYKVIIDDSVSMNEFMNTYEVLEQRGHIYVVKEIEE